MAPNLTVFGLLALGLLSLAAAKALEFRSGDNFHPSIENHHHLVRRKVGPITSPGPLEYMKQLRESMEKRYGEPKDVWCLLDRDTVNDVYRTKPRAERCSRSQKFVFSLSSFVSAYGDKKLAISSVLRFYLQVKSDLRPTYGNSVAVNATVSATLVGNSSFTCNKTVVLHERTLNISNSTKNHYEEWNITQVLCECWNISRGDDLLEVQITFTLPECDNSSSVRVPVQVVDPAIVPLTQKDRRARYSKVQPMLVMYVEQETDKSSMVDHSRPASRSRRSVASRARRFTSSASSCQLANFTINFADLGLHQVLIPYSYNARHCVGSCSPHVIDKVENSTNHARLFASAAAKYVREPLKFKSPPKQPCCVPVEYDHIHLIEIHPDKSFSYKKYLNMSVTKCGCR